MLGHRSQSASSSLNVLVVLYLFILFFFISWRLITLQYVFIFILIGWWWKFSHGFFNKNANKLIESPIYFQWKNKTGLIHLSYDSNDVGIWMYLELIRRNIMRWFLNAGIIKNVKMKLVVYFFFIKNYIEKENWTHVFIY